MNETPDPTPSADAAAPTSPHPRLSKWIRRAGRGIQWGVNIGVLGCAMIVLTPVGNWLDSALTHIDPLSKADYIVILGGERERTVEGARLFRDGWADRIIISSYRPSSQNLSILTQAYGVPEESITLDNWSRSTADHPGKIDALAGVDPEADTFIIVTSTPHTARVRACFAGYGYKNIIIRGPGWRKGGGIVPNRLTYVSRARDLSFMLRESMAWGYYSLTGKFDRPGKSEKPVPEARPIVR